MVAFRAASAGPPDTQVPTAPTNLAANAASSTQINLSWTASTDNVGVTGYQIERCTVAGCANFALLTTVSTTSYNNTGLTASTSYSYRVRATDAVATVLTERWRHALPYRYQYPECVTTWRGRDHDHAINLTDSLDG